MVAAPPSPATEPGSGHASGHASELLRAPGSDEPGANERPSKTQRKKQMHALQLLGERLVTLSPDQLERIDLPEELREAIDFARGVTSHEGRRRHMQYLGKLMRRVDGEALREALGRATGESRAAVALMHHAERWRDRLLADDAALTEFMAEHPGADAQWLRAAIRAARREHDAQQAPRHSREIYRWLHDRLAPSRASDAG
jgi:ribosome-associated protein